MFNTCILTQAADVLIFSGQDSNYLQKELLYQQHVAHLIFVGKYLLLL